MNGCDGKTYDTIIVDEALMMHAGALVYAAALTRCRKMVLIGDVHQIPYIDRDHVTPMRYSTPATFASVTETLKKTHRCPVDVAHVLAGKYEGFCSMSPVMRSMKWCRYSGANIPRSDKLVYLVLFQADKDDLKRQGYNTVMTVHEAQGQTFRDVAYIRTKSKPLQLYQSEGHAIVAISRHTQSFTYYSDEEDMVVKWIRSVRDVGDRQLLEWNNARRMATGEVLSAGYQPKKIFSLNSADRLAGVFQAQAASEVLHAGFVPSDATLLTKKDRLVGGYLSRATVDFSQEIRGYCSDSAISALRYVPHVKHSCNVVKETTPAFTTEETINIQYPAVKDADVGHLQYWYDAIFPDAALYDIKRDQDIVESSDISLRIDDRMTIDPLKIGFNKRKSPTLSPTMRTMMPANRVPSQRETILAMSKRNANAPMLMNKNLSPRVLAGFLFENFKKSCLQLDKIDVDVVLDPIELSPRLVQKWFDKHDSSVASQAQSDIPPEDRMFSRYNFMVKNKLKPPMEAGALYKYAGGQTIAYHKKDANVIFCPIFSEVRDRLLALLKPHIKIMTGKSIEEFEEQINQEFHADFLWEACNRIEDDFAKFDKSQHEALFEAECLVYAFLGVPQEVIDEWRKCHKEAIIKDRLNGVWMKTLYQRKSGDASTFIGNTLVLILVMCAVYDFRHVLMALFVGDDSVLFLLKGYEYKDASSLFADLFNLENKLLMEYRYPYFCSKFMMNVDGRIVFVPNVLKAVTKLGRSDLVNYEHAEEYRVSLKDNLKILSNANIHWDLNLALAERYNITVDSVKLIKGELIRQRERITTANTKTSDVHKHKLRF